MFSEGKIRKTPTFHHDGYLLKTPHSYNYLGIIINYNGDFKVAKGALWSGTKAMFSVIGKCRNLYLHIDIQIKLFNSLVKPVVLYGAEVWDSQNT